MKLIKGLCSVLTITLCILPLTLKAQETDKQQSFILELKQGQLFSIIEPLRKDGANKLVKEYYQTAIPLAQKHGFENIGSLVNQKTLVGAFAPNGVVFTTWPNKAAEQSFTDEPQWTKFKKLRSLAWDELKIFTAEVAQDTVLHFDANKHYTLAIAWFNPKRPDDYTQYINNIENVLAGSGGRFVYKMLSPSFESHASEQRAPNQLTIVEWDSVDGLQKLQSNEEYQVHLPLLRNGVVDFELHLLSTPLKNG